MAGVDVKAWLVLLLFFAICLGAGSVASWLAAHGVRDWYPALRKPKGTPPPWLFGPVWTTLYVLMAIAAWVVWRDYGWTGSRFALLLFFGQLALNVAWPGIFFGSRMLAVAFAAILVLWLAIVFTLLVFHWLRPVAGLLLIPYLFWVSYAGYLSAAIWWLNRDS